MSVIDYVKNIMTSFSRKSIESDIDVVRDDLSNHTLPALQQFMKNFAGHPRLNSRSFKLYDDEIRKQVSIGRNTDMFNTIEAGCLKAELMLNFAYNYVRDHFEEDVTRAALTLAHANVMQLLDALNLYVRYTRRLLDMLLIAESNHKIDASSQELKGIRQADIDYLSKYRATYISVLDMLYKVDTKRVDAMFEAIPEIIVEDVRSKSALEIHGNDKVDPLNLGKNFIVSSINPIWLAGVNLAEYQHNRYLSAKEDANLIKLRITRLKAQYENNPDPKLAEIISNREGQVDKLRAKISRYEKKVLND